ncbi:hypothetical protein MSAN_00164700 [Mycena sanguinolenta]|uniref:NAD(P)-binding protein n=1 Tax=Mycena sanguinolenta TaxID=230812 RepID=A0A8H6ZEA4_9AGAR|nr:hypothetical protein MSAN_00164700 [Mycena sanguinolenta]
MASRGVALVTGAGLLLCDWPRTAVAVNDVSSKSENLDELVEEIKKGRGSSKCTADVSQDEEVRAMIEQVVKQHGSLDVMVANAAILGKEAPFIETTAEQWDRILAVNARGSFLCYKYAGIQMINQGRGGRIIGASSLAGKQVIQPSLTAYSASKFAVRGLTQAAALEFGPHGITVNAYAPGAIDTPMRRCNFAYSMTAENYPTPSVVGSAVRGERLEQVADQHFLLPVEMHWMTGRF